MSQLKADRQGLIEARAEAPPTRVNWSKVESYTQKEGEHLKAFVEHFIQRVFLRHTASNPEVLEYRNLCMYVLVRNLPDIKKEMKEYIAEWEHQPFGIIHGLTQFGDELGTTVFVLQISIKPEVQLWEQFKVHLFFPITKSPLFISKCLQIL